jgi:hypothetical protein
MVMKIHVVMFWVGTPYSDVVGYQHSGGPCCLHLQDEVNGKPFTWKMKAVWSSRTLVSHHIPSWCHKPEGCDLKRVTYLFISWVMRV